MPQHTHAVTVSLSPIGNAPVLKQKKFVVSRDRTVGWINQWLRKYLKCDNSESVVRSYDIIHSHMLTCLSLSLCMSNILSLLPWTHPSARSMT